MKIGIVNDLPLAVEALRRAVALNPEHQVIWVANNGAQAVQLCAQQTPDLVLMDLIMPGMDGVEATRRIMRDTPCAVLVVTVSVGANAWRVFDAMGHGALDAVDTPTLGTLSDRAAPLHAKIDTVARLLRDRNAGSAAETGARAAKGRLVAVGASAGGPAALAALLRALPADFPAALVIVQHVDQHFAPGMAQWLARDSALPVDLAREGDRPAAGRVLLAGGDEHLVLKGPEQLGYSTEPRDYIYRPSVDVFFQSVGRWWPGEAVGVLLTGMGRDGAMGLKALRNQGHHTIAQDSASSAVYGMPKAAAALDAAVDILPLDRIAPKLAEIFGGDRR